MRLICPSKFRTAGSLVVACGFHMKTLIFIVQIVTLQYGDVLLDDSHCSS